MRLDIVRFRMLLQNSIQNPVYFATRGMSRVLSLEAFVELGVRGRKALVLRWGNLETTERDETESCGLTESGLPCFFQFLFCGGIVHLCSLFWSYSDFLRGGVDFSIARVVVSLNNSWWNILGSSETWKPCRISLWVNFGLLPQIWCPSFGFGDNTAVTMVSRLMHRILCHLNNFIMIYYVLGVTFDVCR